MEEINVEPIEGELISVDDVNIADRFSNKQRLAIELLGRGGMKNSDIARAVGISYNTLLRWGKDADFRNEVALYESRRGAEVREKMMEKLDEAENESINVLIDLLKNGSNDNVRLKAALAIIETKKKLTDTREGAVEVSFMGMPAPAMPVHEIHRGDT